MATEGSWRAQLLVPNQNYEVQENWSFAGSSFIKGQIVKFESCGYERYDNETLFRFITDGLVQVFRLRDSEPDSKVNQLFKIAKL